MLAQVKQGIGRVGESASETGRQLRLLGEAHVELLEEELSLKRGQLFRAAVLLGMALSTSLVALVMFSLGLVQVIVSLWNEGHTIEAYFIVGAAWAVVSVALGQIGFSRMREASPIPYATIESLKESFKCLGKNGSPED